jgi:TRAP-type mannitol/chloroaromatic compound transport system permease small subunit
MPSIFILYVRLIDKITDVIGRITMYTVFAMMGILVLSFVTRNIINFPLLWIIEMAQFIMTGYYLMGGAYSDEGASTCQNGFGLWKLFRKK